MTLYDILFARFGRGSLYDLLFYRKLLGSGTLLGTDTDPYLFRRSPSLGAYKTERDEIVGVSVGWNQLFKPYTTSGSVLGMDYAWNNGKCTISGIATGGVSLAVSNPMPDFVLGHKYYLKGCPSGGANTTYTLRYNANGFGENGSGTILNCTNANGNREIKFGTNFPIIYIASGTDFTTPKVYEPQFVDLTALLGSTIADYIYSLEQANAGAGVAFFRKYFDKDYYAYDSGSIKSVSGLVSHDMVGFNQWDGTNSATEKYLNSSGAEVGNSQWNITDYIRVVPNTAYYFKDLNPTASSACICWYDEGKGFISANSIASNGFTATSPTSASYLKCTYNATNSSIVCINLSSADNGQYAPYEKHSYPLDSTVTLRGKFDLVDGKLKADGDTYEANGTIKRNWGEVDMSTLGLLQSSGFYYRMNSQDLNMKADESIKFTSFDTNITSIYYNSNNGQLRIYVSDDSQAPSGKLVYPLATPTTETAQPFAKNQKVSPSGTEEYVTTSVVPVGHNTEYYG